MDAREGLRKLKDDSVDCVVTSPPYWALRDYGNRPSVWGGSESCKHAWTEARKGRTDKRTVQEKRSGGASVHNNVENRSNYQDSGRFCSRCGAWKGCLGLEPSVELYLEHLVGIFDEVRRVLKPSGTCWIVLGDTYAGSWGNYAGDGKHTQRPQTQDGTRWKRAAYANAKGRPPSSLLQRVPPKCLCLIPERFTIEMVRRGWILRNRIVWHKPNHMPSSVKDRFACSWEYVLFFVKSRRYFFDLDAVRVPHTCLERKGREKKERKQLAPRHVAQAHPPGSSDVHAYHPLGKNPADYWTVPAETRTLGALIGKSGAVKVLGGKGWRGHPQGGEARIIRERDPRWLSPGGKNPGDCWDVTTTSYSGAHFAVFPERLIETPIKAGCPLLTCSRCGKPKRQVSKRPANDEAFNIRVRDVQRGKLKAADRRASSRELQSYAEAEYASLAREIVVAPGCRCRARFQRGLVLDPFIGSGTTARVAKRLGRNFIGFEVNRRYY